MTKRKPNALASAAKSDSRLAVNLLSAAMAVLVLFAATEASHGGLSNSIDKISKNFWKLTDYAPAYSNYAESETYLSRISPFNPRGMAGLYALTVRFMDVVLPKDFLSEHADKIVNRLPEGAPDDIQNLLEAEWPFLLMLVALMIPVVVIPLCGLLVCCCRCYGNCDPQLQQRNKKRDHRKENLLGMLLAVLASALLCCAVCVFTSNEQMQDGIDKLPKTVSNTIGDTNKYFDSATEQAKHLFVTNYNEFFNTFNGTVKGGSKNIIQQLEIRSNASAMMDLHAFVSRMPKLKESLETLKTDTNSLRASASQLNDAMYQVKEDLLNALVDCVLPECRDVKNNLSQLPTNIDFSKVPDVSQTLNQLSNLDSNALKNAVDVGIGKLNSIEEEIKLKLDESLQKVNDQVNEAGVAVVKYLNNRMRRSLVCLLEIDRQINPEIMNAWAMFIESFFAYRYYPALAISYLSLLVTICIALGLIFGTCTKRPDSYGDNCCKKGAGSHFLTCSVTIMIIFGIFLALATLATFVLGMSMDRLLCYPIRNPEHSKVIDIVDNLIDKHFVQCSNTNDLKFRLKDVFSRCYKNESIYNVFNLKSVFDIDAMQENFDVSPYLNQMLVKLNKTRYNDFEMLSKEDEKTLESLKMFNSSSNFGQFQDELKGIFENVSFDEILDKLMQLMLTNASDLHINMVKKEVSASILQISIYKDKLLMPMKAKADAIIDVTKHLDLELKMNSTSLSIAITKLLAEIKGAEVVLKTNGTEILMEAAKKLRAIILNQVDSYVYRAENVMKNELGQCGPWNVVINATLTATCDKVLLPWNGYWFSLFLTLILFVPTMIVSDKLASLYQNNKPYGEFIETRTSKCDEKKPKLAKNSHRIWEKATRLLENTRQHFTHQAPELLIPRQDNNKVDV